MSCSANNKKKKPDEASIKFKLMGRQVELVIQNNTAIKAGRGRRLLESEPHRQTWGQESRTGAKHEASKAGDLHMKALEDRGLCPSVCPVLDLKPVHVKARQLQPIFSSTIWSNNWFRITQRVWQSSDSVLQPFPSVCQQHCALILSTAAYGLTLCSTLDTKTKMDGAFCPVFFSSVFCACFLRAYGYGRNREAWLKWDTTMGNEI